MATVVLLAAIGWAQAINPLDIWLKRSPTPAENDLFAIAQGNGRYVAVGDKGVVLTSTNGVQWTTARGESDMQLTAVAYGNGVFVAGGWSNASNRVGIALVSSNGTDWVPGNLVQDDEVAGLAFGNGRFVAHFGQEIPTQISIDGRNWTNALASMDYDIGNVTWGAGLFLAGEYGDIVYSTNGTDWESRPSPVESPQRVSFLNNRFVVIGDVEDFGSVERNFATSPDALNWTTNIFTTDPGYNGGNAYVVGFVAGHYVVIGNESAQIALWVSANEGQQWQKLIPPDFIGAPADLLSESNRLIAVGAKGGIAISTNGLVWIRVHGRTAQRPWSVTHGGGRFVAASTAGGIKSSIDGIEWTTHVVLSTDRNWYGATHGDGRFVVVGNTATATSTDGTNWSGQSLPVYADLMSVAYGGGQFAAVGNGFFNNSYRILTSSNGQVWSNRLSGSGYSLYGITHANGTFTAVGSRGRILNSSNGITWTESLVSTQVFFRSIAYGNGAYVAVGASIGLDGTVSIPAAYASTNGVDWSPAIFISTNEFDLYSVTFADGVFLAAGARAPTLGSIGGRLLSSVDGKTWQERYRLPQPLEFRDFTGVGHGHGAFIAVGPGGDIYQTADVRAQLSAELGCPGGCPRLWLSGYSNALYAVESSTNLVHWQRYSTNRVTGGSVEIPGGPASSRRFFRAVMIPE